MVFAPVSRCPRSMGWEPLLQKESGCNIVLAFLFYNQWRFQIAFQVLCRKFQEKKIQLFADHLVENFISEDSVFLSQLQAKGCNNQTQITNACESFHKHFNSYFLIVIQSSINHKICGSFKGNSNRFVFQNKSCKNNNNTNKIQCSDKKTPVYLKLKRCIYITN